MDDIEKKKLMEVFFTRQMGLPIGKKRVKESSHQVEPSKVYLTVLLAPVHFLLYLKTLILQYTQHNKTQKSKTAEPVKGHQKLSNKKKILKKIQLKRNNLEI